MKKPQHTVGRTSVRHLTCSTKVEPTLQTKNRLQVEWSTELSNDILDNADLPYLLLDPDTSTARLAAMADNKKYDGDGSERCLPPLDPATSEPLDIITITAKAMNKPQHTVGRTSVRHLTCSTKVEPTLQTKNRLQAGFTLLEMILVLFLIGLMASATLMLTEGVEDQAKYDATKQRMEMMRKAIVGDPTRTVNGGPEISGFVADMGRLPECVAELLELGIEKSPATIPKTYDSPCDASETVAVWSPDASTGLGFGWRGPYIQVLPERNGELRFRDGYGNSDAPDAQNSGWTWQLFDAADVSTATIADAQIIRVQSKGLDNTTPYPAGTIDDLDPDNRPTPLIVSADWEVQLPATVNVTFKNQSASNLPSTDEKLVLRIYLRDLTTSEEVEGDDGANDYLTLDASSAISGIPNTRNFTLNSTPSIPIGTRAYSIVCYELPATGDPDDYLIFDGDCDLSNPVQTASNIRIFSVLPRQNLNLTLDWIIE